jgi:hypothetical protein
MIDPSTGWFEVKEVKDKPEYIGFDNGGEYKNVFEELVNNYGIKKKNSNPFNPQSNGIIARVHLMPNYALRTAEIDGRELDDKDPWEPFLTSATYAIRITFHIILKATPGQLVFGRYMVLPISFMADRGGN